MRVSPAQVLLLPVKHEVPCTCTCRSIHTGGLVTVTAWNCNGEVQHTCCCILPLLGLAVGVTGGVHEASVAANMCSINIQTGRQFHNVKMQDSTVACLDHTSQALSFIHYFPSVLHNKLPLQDLLACEEPLASAYPTQSLKPATPRCGDYSQALNNRRTAFPTSQADHK